MSDILKSVNGFVAWGIEGTGDPTKLEYLGYYEDKSPSSDRPVGEYTLFKYTPTGAYYIYLLKDTGRLSFPAPQDLLEDYFSEYLTKDK